jgi:PAS domain S-box-containing protein
MAQTKYPYLDLTVLPEIRSHVVTPRAALLFDQPFQNVLWANGEGTNLLGSVALRDLLEGDFSFNPVIKRQISAAVDKLSDQNEASAMMRVRAGFTSRLLGFSVRHITLPAGETAVLLVTDSLHSRGRSELDDASVAAGCLDGYSHASAILGPDGDVLAESEHFGALDVSADELSKLVTEVATEDDRLVKRMITTSSGAVAAGIARLSDSPASHILIIADAHDPEEVFPEPEGSSTKTDADDLSMESVETAEAEPEDAPVVGAFSNRRAPAGGGLARWYFKQPAATSDEPAVDADPGEPDSVPKSVPTAEDSVDFADIEETTVTASKESSSESTNKSDGEPAPADKEPAFQFTVGPKPVRFVWDMDTNNLFRSVSAEFAQAVGPKSADIEGQLWQDLCELHRIENGSEITALLHKGDTWSGKTVLWPVEGTDLRVPIDLAGLPSYGRNRIFDGFNGFGIIRTADAVVDPGAAGTHEQQPAERPETPQPVEEQEDSQEFSKPQSPITVVDLEDRRESRAERSLSTDEQETFEEIGEKLSDEAEISVQDDHSKAETGDSDTDDTGPGDVIPAATADPDLNNQDGHEDGGIKVGTPDHNVDTSILARLPIPVLVYRANDLLFGNVQFFQLTGYDDLNSLAQAGGIEALFGNAVDEDSDTHPQIYHASGQQLDVQANLQRVPWDDDRAMLLTLRQGQDDDDLKRPSDHSTGIDGDSGSDTDATDALVTEDASAESGPSARLAPVIPLQDASRRQESETSAAFGGLEAEDLRNILDTATDGVVILSDEGIIQALNKSAEALFDVEPAAVLEQSFTKILAPESQRSAMDYLSGMSGTGVASLMNDGREVIGKTARGGLIPLFMTIGKLQKTDACCAVMRDITQWKKAEEDLLGAKAIAENASKQKTEFLAKVSHEIRTPLNAIIGFSDMMIEERFGKIDNDRYRGYLRDIHRSGNHVLELVNDLLDISKIEAGKMDLEFDACDLNTSVSETVALTQPDANKERIIIRTSLSAMVPKIVADPRSLRQIILNLVSNSIKYTKPGGQVIVSTVYEESGEVVLRVRDTGVGMGELDLARALQPFQQIDAQTNKQGTGLGLPLTKAMVEANRARFEIESEPEEGTLVEIYFPSQRVLADR